MASSTNRGGLCPPLDNEDWLGELLQKVIPLGTNFSTDELETFLEHFHDAVYLEAPERAFNTSFQAKFNAAVPLGTMVLPVSKIPALIDICGLSHYDPQTFTPIGLAEALYKHSVLPNEDAQGLKNRKKNVPVDSKTEGITVWNCWASVCAPRGPTPAQLAPFMKTADSKISFEEFVSVLSIAKREELDPRKLPAFPFDPDSHPKQIWDGLIMFFLMYTTFSVPYMLSFGEDVGTVEVPASFKGWSFWDVLDLILDVLFCTDVCVNFCTAYVSRGVYVTRLRGIAWHYIYTWFFIDFFGSVPFDKIVTAMSDDSADMQAKLRPLRLVRILKIVRAVRFLQKLHQLEQKDTTGALKTGVSIFRAIFLMVFVAHSLACIFYLMIDKESTNNWMGAADPSMLDFERTTNTERYVLGF